MLPPDYGKLPILMKEKEERVTDNNIKTLKNWNDNQHKVEKNTKPSSIEQSILKEIE